MNKKRKARIDRVVNDLLALQVEIEIVKIKEEEVLENTPASLQDTDRYYESESWVEALETAGEAVDDAIECLKCGD